MQLDIFYSTGSNVESLKLWYQILMIGSFVVLGFCPFRFQILLFRLYFHLIDYFSYLSFYFYMFSRLLGFCTQLYAMLGSKMKIGRWKTEILLAARAHINLLWSLSRTESFIWPGNSWMVRYFIDRFLIFFPVLKKDHKIIIIDDNSCINIKTGGW